MTAVTFHSPRLSESLQILVDSRLDTIDRMLLGRVSRAERLAIVREVESQIHELLEERHTDDLSREDVLAVLARLDPPEAFLPETSEREPLPARSGSARRLMEPARSGGDRAARASGIWGLAAIACVVILFPLSFLLGEAIGSLPIAVSLWAVTILTILTCSVLGLVTAARSRRGGVWTGVGVVTSIIGLLCSLALAALLMMELA
jgi:hypothetical protein